MQFLHDMEIRHQGAQLGGRAELQLGPGVEVEGLVRAVGMDAQVVAVRPALVEHEAVGHLADDRTAREQLVADHADRLREFRLGKFLQDGGDARLSRRVDRRLGAQIEPVERVEARQAEHCHQPGARLLGSLLLDVGDLSDRRRLGAEFQLGIECRVAQAAVDDTGVVHRPDVAVAQFAEPFTVVEQVMTGQPAGEQEAERLPIDLALARQLLFIFRSAGQHLVGFVEIGAVPDPHRVGKANHLAIAGKGT